MPADHSPCPGIMMATIFKYSSYNSQMIGSKIFTLDALSDQQHSDNECCYQGHHLTDYKNPKSWYQRNQHPKFPKRQKEYTVSYSVPGRTFS